MLATHPALETVEFPCPSCGEDNIAFPPPDWARNVVPDIALVYNADREESAPPGKTAKTRAWWVRYDLRRSRASARTR